MSTMKKGQLLCEMLQCVSDGHNGQFDRAGKPYVLHPLKVMHYLQSDDEELQCIALGHDLIEDTSYTADILRRLHFTERIVRGIECLSKQKGQSYEDYKEQVYSSRDAMLVKLADLKDNMDLTRLKHITNDDFVRIRKYHYFSQAIQARLGLL